MYNLALCGVYLPPPVRINMLKKFLNNCNRVSELHNYNTCILGDFNLGCIEWSLDSDSQKYFNLGISTLASTLIDFANLNDLKQCNSIKNTSNRVLDLLFTNINDCFVSAAVSSLVNIDKLHPPIIATFMDFKVKMLKGNSIATKRYNFFKCDYDLINNYLTNIKWKVILSDHLTVDEIVTKFYEVLNSCIQEFVPEYKQKKSKYPIWFSHNLKGLIRERESLDLRFKKYKNPMDGISLDIINERCELLASENYKSYINTVENNITKNPKCFWSYTKSKRQNNSSFPNDMTDGVNNANGGKDISNLFAKYFSSICKSPLNIIGQSFQKTPVNALNTISNIKISREEIIKALNGLDYRKGSGSDDIPPQFIKKCAESLSEPLFLIYEKSLLDGIFPTLWKIAKIVPIYKSNDKKNVLNYRPISLLTTFGKVFESLILPHMITHFKPLINDAQHGFIKSRSTCTNLVEFTEIVQKSMDAGHQIEVIYSDFSKAFDLVPHEVLNQKLYGYGYTGKLLQWLKSYTENRKFYVVISGYQSSLHEIRSGVPQGSHLGPFLFNIFINDLPATFSHCTPFMYADDLKILKVVNTIEDVALLQSDLDRLVNWCKDNNMLLNVKKCFHVTLTRKHKTIKCDCYINGVPIVKVDTIKDLGVVFDSKLTFDQHISEITKKATRLLGFILRTCKMFTQAKTKIMLYNSLVRSILEYCSTVWRPHYSTSSLRIERIQKRFLWHLAKFRGISESKPSYKDRLQYFKIQSLTERRDILDLTFLHKLINYQYDCPNLLPLFKFKVPYKCPRNPVKLFQPPICRTRLGSNSPVSRLCRLENEYSAKIDIFWDSLRTIKTKLA